MPVPHSPDPLLTGVPLVLASTSRWRLQLLRDAGVDCEAVDPGVDESAIRNGDPVVLALDRARAKAAAVASERPDALVIGADQVLHLDGEAFGKPRDDADWKARLQSLRGRTHDLTTGVALVGPGVDETLSVTTGVRFRGDVTDEELDAYVASGEARGCAGGYMVERRGAWLVEGIEGDWLNVVGLPVLHLVGRLRALGLRLPETRRARDG